jgi:hypothetical protein
MVHIVTALVPVFCQSVAKLCFSCCKTLHGSKAVYELLM